MRDYLIMTRDDALKALSALAQPTRLEVFRLLVQTGPDGLMAGDIAERLDSRQNTMSTNLSILYEAGLLGREREGRNIRYHASITGMQALITYLMADCCGGRPEVCATLFDTLKDPA